MRAKNRSQFFALIPTLTVDSYSSISTIYSCVPEQLQTSKSQRTSQAVPYVYPAAEPLQLGGFFFLYYSRLFSI